MHIGEKSAHTNNLTYICTSPLQPPAAAICMQVFDDVWQQFARLASPSRGSAGSLDYASPAEEFSSPAAASTTVLVAGATGRVGRILVRKLLLRGYKVSRLF